MVRPNGIPFPHIPLDEIGGNRLSADQLCTMLAEIWANRLSVEVKVEMVMGGWRKFRDATRPALRNLGLHDAHIERLWRRLNQEIPQVAQISGGPVS